MNRRKIVEIGSAHRVQAATRSVHHDALRNLPDLPVLPETLLQMELQIRERVVDLAEVSRLILTDLGAALQVMRLAGREYGQTGEKPTRVEDIVADLGLQACFDEIARSIPRKSAGQSAVFEAWAHSRKVAEVCSALAEEAEIDTDAVDAYLVGLFHELGILADILDWEVKHLLPIDQALAGLTMAEAWSLPSCVLEYFSDHRDRKASSRWITMVERAHAVVDSPMPLPIGT